MSYFLLFLLSFSRHNCDLSVSLKAGLMYQAVKELEKTHEKKLLTTLDSKHSEATIPAMYILVY